MIKVKDLSYSFPQKDLYNKISFELNKGQHCAFIGSRGIGKTTLLDMILNPNKYMFKGSIEIEDSLRTGYVSQFYDVDKSSNLSIFEYIASDFIKLEKALIKIGQEMATSSNLESLLEEYQSTRDAFESLSGDDYENFINKKLNLSNLSHIKNSTLSSVSGGEFKLIQVIKVMISLSDFIIMDEPDVFLDFENLNSLKNLINSYKGTLLVVTHNRYLLNHCFDKIIHLENTDLEEFDGNYIDYNFSLLEGKIELQELAHIDTEEIKRNDLLIKKFQAAAERNTEASIGAHVNSRVKIQERLLARRVKEPFININRPLMAFPTPPIDDKDAIVLKVSDLTLSFEDVLLENINFDLKRGEKLVIIGPNGSGKTTLLEELYKNANPAITFEEGVKVGYLSQLKKERLDEKSSVNEVFFDYGFKTYDEIKNHLLAYGFDEDLGSQQISSLSGGEKNILQLAKLSYNKTHILLLDEPTSHLDTYSQISLEKAIEDYKGAVVMVSHDFYSIINCMDYVLLIEDKTIRKITMKKFKKMIYKNHFDRDYLEIEQKKKDLEIKIEMALSENNFELAKVLCEDLRDVIKEFL